MICFKMKLTKLQFYFHTSHTFIMQHTNTKNKNIYGSEFRLPVGYLTKNRLSQVVGSLIQQMNRLYSAFCILTLFRPHGDLLWPTCILFCTEQHSGYSVICYHTPQSWYLSQSPSNTNSGFHNALLEKLSKPYSALKQWASFSETEV